MARLSENDINDVRNKADIAEIIGRYIPLIKKGKGLTAVCPFHDDHNPSLSISQDKQIYKCFVCGNGGNVFTFVQNFEKISFIEAVLKVAEYCNIDLGYQKMDFIESRYDEQTKAYFKLMNEAIAYQQYQLNSVAGGAVTEYLEKRGYDDTIINTFAIGYNPGKDSLFRFLKAKGYAEKDMVSLNLVRYNEDDFSDVFAERITFPIYDKYGSPIAYTARTIRRDFEPKYINTGETVLYTKGDTLYNYHRAAADVKQRHCVIVVEGVTDVIALFKAGYYNVVATLGTAMSAAQIKLLKQLSMNTILCYDGDEAGQNADFKNGQLLNEAGLNVQIISNATGKDPDEIANQLGIDALQALLKAPVTWIEFVMNHLLKRYDLHNYNQKKSYTVEVAKQISLVKDEFDQQSFLKRLAALTEFDLTQLNTLITRKPPLKRASVQHPAIAETKRFGGYLRAEYEILSQMLNGPDACQHFKEKIGFLPTDQNNRLAMLILDFTRRQENFRIADFISFLDDDALRDLTMNLVDWEYLPKEFNAEALDDAFNKIKTGLIDDKINTIRRQQKLTQDLKLKQHLADELIKLKKEKIEIQESCMKEEV
ncbi:MAG: DNA primase [Erysipelotrichaceae bacterium]|nr:DNA primase [Erysipelotrichaceae bacterium]